MGRPKGSKNKKTLEREAEVENGEETKGKQKENKSKNKSKIKEVGDDAQKEKRKSENSGKRTTKNKVLEHASESLNTAGKAEKTWKIKKVQKLEPGQMQCVVCGDIIGGVGYPTRCSCNMLMLFN